MKKNADLEQPSRARERLDHMKAGNTLASVRDENIHCGGP